MTDENKKNQTIDIAEDVSKEALANTIKKKSVGQTLLIPALAVVTGLILGAIIIATTSEEVYAAFQQSFGAGLSTAWNIF